MYPDIEIDLIFCTFLTNLNSLNSKEITVFSLNFFKKVSIHVV